MLLTSGLILVKFGATWCGPCRTMDKTISNVMPDFENIQYQPIDVDDEPELSKQYKIKSVPTTILLKNGVEVFRLIGAIRAEALRSAIREGVSEAA